MLEYELLLVLEQTKDMTRKKLAIIAGGKSPEHDVSLISAKNILDAVDTSKYECEIIGISKEGVWYFIPSNIFDSNTQIGSNEQHIALYIQPFCNPAFSNPSRDFEYHPDLVFPIAHGIMGEDGTLQGVLEHLNIPYVGPGVLGSAMGMDKDITKKLAALAGVKVTPSVTLRKNESYSEKAIVDQLGLPLFIKPVNMGSAVGVEKVNKVDEIKEALTSAFIWDNKVLIEKAIIGREVETAVLGNEIAEVTGVGEIIIENDFYTYENKYENDKAKVEIPARNMSEESIKLIQEMALKTYKAVELEGMSRIDFFYVSDDEIYLNEVNTLPGYTNISMYPKLWEERGLSFKNLISKLLELAIERKT